MRTHTLPDTALDALATGGGADALTTLRTARRSRTLGLIRLLVTDDPTATAAFHALGELRATHPEATDRVLDDPVTSAWATALAARGRGHPADLALVTAAAAIRAGVNLNLRFRSTSTAVLPSLGTLTPTSANGPTNALDWTPFPTLGPFTITTWPPGLLPDDLDTTPATHHWNTTLTTAWTLLTRDHPTAATETTTLLTTATPLHAPHGAETSATLTDALGCVFLSPGTDPETTAATLTHETHHTKLSALMDIHPLTHPSTTRYYAPWRPDPRPLTGLLHGTYAHLGVTAFWATRRTTHPHHRADVEFARWRTAVADTTTTLRTAPLTETGHRFVAGLTTAAHHWLTHPVDPTAQAEADHLNHTHRTTWLTRHT
ncbi:aKG-HExxH-type peptide beta-hydroxylase [Actinokineospora pegani]|uniref:aKG-HExxH-type peptide beta-hydroxylase n=1 Tax=Actinokineospora pegani TaxID=2654637 RepID=UPI0012EAAF4C|nr:HEXXH motif-containing putative peptide modification protein [Actinokineospora pegani]